MFVEEILKPRQCIGELSLLHDQFDDSEQRFARLLGGGAPRTLATSGWITAGVVNAGDGTHEHPTQALLDAFTIRKRRFGADSRGRDLSGIAVTIVGDILHSRVARSNVWLLDTLGAVVTLVA